VTGQLKVLTISAEILVTSSVDFTCFVYVAKIPNVSVCIVRAVLRRQAAVTNDMH